MPDQTEERLEQANRDLIEVDRQAADGELDAATAEHLREVYRNEIAALQASSARELTDDELAPVQPARRGRRALLGTLLIVSSVVAITVAVVQSAGQREGGFITGTGADTGVDLASVSNEEMAQVIAANPDNPAINRMRLALAGRYFETGDQQAAFRWYDEVLQSEPTEAEASEALGRIGWLVFVSGDTALAEQSLTRALELAPANLDAAFFLGRLYADTDRPAEAIDVWSAIADDPSLPDNVREVARDAIAAVEEGR